MSGRPKAGAEEAATVPCKGAANAQIQLLPCIHCQRFVLVGVTQRVHGLADVRVGDGAEFCSIDTLLPGAPFVHDWLNGIQDLPGRRNDRRFCYTGAMAVCTCPDVTSKQMFSPSLSQSSHKTT